MKTTKVQLSNGNLLRIDGGDAEQIASIITERQQTALNAVEEALPVPGLGIRATGPGAPSRQPELAVNEGDETPLELPAMTFK